MRPVPSNIASRLTQAAGPIARRGLEQTTIEEVADATGVPKATLYYYFTGKEEILAFLFAELLGIMAEQVARAVEGSGPAAERLHQVLVAQLSVMVEQRDACQALLGDLGRAGRIPEIAAAIDHAYLAPVRRLLAEGAGDGSLRPAADPQAVALAVFGAVTTWGLFGLLDEERVDAAKEADVLFDLLLRGCGTAGPPQIG